MSLYPYQVKRGDIFGKLTVLKRLESKRAQGPRYRCGCTCGRQANVKRSKLVKGEVTACRRCTPVT